MGLNKTDKKMDKKPFIIVVVVVIIALVGAGILTKTGTIPNYLGLEFLCSGNDSPSPELPVEDSDYVPIDDFDHVPMKKPIIYLYPQQEQLTSVKLSLRGKLTVTYPKYNDGWEVVAHPDGSITDLSDNKEYSYLFWEGVDDNASYDLTSGFVVKGSDTVGFLQQSLATLGLTPKEYNEFIVYWLPQMINNDYNLIHFATKAEYDDRAVLDIKPVPDSVLRVFMVFKKLDKNNENVTPQKLQSFERKGFSVVEWGGTEVKN